MAAYVAGCGSCRRQINRTAIGSTDYLGIAAGLLAAACWAAFILLPAVDWLAIAAIVMANAVSIVTASSRGQANEASAGDNRSTPPAAGRATDLRCGRAG